MRSTQTEPLRLCLLYSDEAESNLLAGFLRDAGYDVERATRRGLVTDGAFAAGRDIVLIPIGGQEPDTAACEPFALRALAQIRDQNPAVQVILVAKSDIDLATCCRAVELGAAGFVDATETDIPEELLDRIQQAAERREKILAEQRELHTGSLFEQTGMVGQSEAMAQLLLQTRRAAMISDAPVLIYGESGTGKQLLAEAIHQLDPKRSSKPFLSINCAAISGTLADSALFGHKKGAFTGATEERAGYFRSARGGTVLLDEISELDPALQPKLLRVLQENRVLPVGADTEEEVDVRVIVASNRRLETLVEKGEFRLDLYQRLNVITLTIPPLRERTEDIPTLVRFFLKRYASYYPRPIRHVDERVYEVLASSIGQGNIRELENLVRRILAFKKSGDTIELTDIPVSALPALGGAARRDTTHDPVDSFVSGVGAVLRDGRMTLAQMIDACEELLLRETISTVAGTHEEVANRLGITRRTFYNKLQKYNLSLPARNPS